MAVRWTEAELKAYSKGRSKQDVKVHTQKAIMVDAYTSNVKGWRTIGGKRYYFKSLWEINYAHTLQYMKELGKIVDWEYEPRVFEFPKDKYKAGPFYYKPDFKVYFRKDLREEKHGPHEWHEVKGWMNGSSKTKLKRFAKHYPVEIMKIIGAEWFKHANKHIKHLIPGWESLPSK